MTEFMATRRRQTGEAAQIKGTSLSRKRRFKQNLLLMAMFLPVLAVYIAFRYAPMGGLIIAFKEYNFRDGVFGSPWIGLDNFQLLFRSPKTLSIIWNTFYLSLLSLFAGFPVPILLALLLNEVKNTLFKKTVQTIVYIPHFFSWVVVGGIVTSIFAQESGVVNTVVKYFTGGEPYAFLYQPGSWITIFIGSGIWKEAGFGTIIYLAALTAIDPSLYEAACLDGAGKWNRMRYITLPGILPTIATVFILSVGRVMEVGFDKVYMLSNPAVGNISDVISTYIYRLGIQGTQFSLTTAMGLFESLVGLILVLLTNRIAGKFGQALW